MCQPVEMPGIVRMKEAGSNDDEMDGVFGCGRIDIKGGPSRG